MASRKEALYRSHLKPWSIVVVDSLDRGSVPIDHLVEIAYSVVPPGRGFRRHGSKPKRVSVEQATRNGCKQIVRDSIRSMQKRGSIRTYELDGLVYCELTEQGKRRLIVGRSR